MSNDGQFKLTLIKYGRKILRIFISFIIGLFVTGGLFFFTLTLIIYYFPSIEYQVRIFHIGILSLTFSVIAAFIGGFCTGYVSLSKINGLISISLIIFILIYPLYLINLFAISFVVIALALGCYMGLKYNGSQALKKDFET
mgnify:CR=1 FL=1